MITKYSGDACSLWPNGEVRYLDPSPALIIKACQVSKFSKYQVIPIFAVALVITSLTAK
jgi:hypothetical protein